MRTLPGTEYYRGRDSLPAERLLQLEEMAFQHGRTYDSYLVTESDRAYFWSAGCRGVIGFRRWVKYLHVVGGLLCADEDKPALLAQFHAFARANRKHVIFYNICDDDASLFRSLGFQITKVGEEPIIDLATATWRGKPFEWLRRQENYSRRHGVECREIVADPEDETYRQHIVPELERVSREHLKSTPYRRELKFFEGQFAPLELRRRRLFVARNRSGCESLRGARIEAFAVCNPADAGRMWAIEIYRRRTDSPRGVMPHLMMHIARQMRDEGVERLSLSLCPGLRCEEPLEGDSALARRGATIWWRWGNWIFDLHGIYHYKSRFRPAYQNRYYAAWPKLSLLSMRSTFLLWGVLEPTYFGLVRHIWRRWRQRRKGAQLAVPEPIASRQSIEPIWPVPVTTVTDRPALVAPATDLVGPAER